MINTITYPAAYQSEKTQMDAFILARNYNLGKFVGKVNFGPYIILGFRDDN